MTAPGLATTFLTLQESQNEAALALLVQAIEAPIEAIHDGAFTAILARRSPAGHDVILRRFHLLDEPHLEMVRQHRYLSSKSLRDALLGSDRQTCMNACRVILWFREYGMVSTLLSALYNQQCKYDDLLGDTLFELLQTLSNDWIAYGEIEQEGLAEQQRQKLLKDRREALDTLYQGVSEFGLKHRRMEPIEGFLLLANSSEPLLAKILDNLRHPAFATMMNLLAKSHTQNVTRLLFASYSQPKPIKSLLAVAANRSDHDFISKLISLLSDEKNETVQKNIRLIENISWIDNIDAVLGNRSDEDQTVMLQYLLSTRLSKDRLFSVVRFFFKQGKVEARRIASEAMAQFSGTHVNKLLLDSLNDSDPIVQANIIRNIRHRGIPEASGKVFELRNSPYEIVRMAIRDTFDELSFDHYFASYDMLDEESRISMGRLVYDIDSRTIPLLKKELIGGRRSARARAMEIVEFLAIPHKFENEILCVMDEGDPILQILALELLAQIPTKTAQQRIQKATYDPSPSVANAAQRLLWE